MANSLYNISRQACLESGIGWLTNTIVAYLIDTGAYTFSASHDHLSDVPGGARIAGPVTLTGKATTGGAADADDVTFSSVSGTTCEALLLVDATSGVESTSPLIAYIDTATGLPITPNGGDIIVPWDNGTNKIFRP